MDMDILDLSHLAGVPSTTKSTELKAPPLAKLVTLVLILKNGHSLLHVPITEQFLTSSNLTGLPKCEFM